MRCRYKVIEFFYLIQKADEMKYISIGKNCLTVADMV